MSSTSVQEQRFNVRAFTRTARGNHREQLDLESFASSPLPAETLHALRYLRDLESSTMAYLRNVLVTPTHKDARVTAFLVTWGFEKFWIADALTALLEANGVEDLAPEAGHRRQNLNQMLERRGPISRALGSLITGTRIVAVHTTTELVDSWVIRAAYERVSESVENGALRSAIDLLLSVKDRHTAFFAEEAEWRLSASVRTARVVRGALARAALPTGSIDHSNEERTFFEQFTFGGALGRVRATQLQAAIAALPGIGERAATTVVGRLTS